MVSRKLFSAVGKVVGLMLFLGLAVRPGMAYAGPITDPPNDFIPSYLGPHNGDLDVLSAEVLLGPNTLTLHAVLNGLVGTTPGGFYVWGFNRGAGTQGFPTIAPGVIFDKVVVLNNNGTSNIAGTTVTISGNEILGVVPLSALPSTGFTPENYTWNLWPRSPAITGNPNGNVADFAPDNSDAAVTLAPEPSTMTLLGFGAALVGWKLRKRRMAA
jgi:hypothetical protein